MQSVTIFGGAGFIGHYVVRPLATKGIGIQIAGRNEEKAAELRPAGNVGQITPIQADIRDMKQVKRAIGNADTVINLVGILNERGKRSFKNIHHKGAENIAKACKSMGVKTLVHISALGADQNSRSKYARSKAAGEEAVRKYFPEATILRPSIVFGPEDQFFNKFAAIARLFKALPLIGGGHTRFQPVYVGDVADAILTCLEAPETKGQTYELGGPNIYSFKELMQLTLKESYRKACLIPLPFWMATIQGFFFKLFLPNPPLTPDQVNLLKQDNVVSNNAKTLQDLGITPTAAEIILPTYLERFRPSGPWARFRDRLKV